MKLAHIGLVGIMFGLAACGDGKSPPSPAKGVKVGKPYNVGWKTYYPEHDPNYDETGVASWYGPGFHGNKTATGETFDQDALTAAHPTLPIPSMVKVTNKDNGRSALVRINDRGPFSEGRIIDLSRASARKLGITGLANVRVQFMEEESKKLWASMGTPAPERGSNREPTNIYADSVNDEVGFTPNEPGEDSTQQASAPIRSVETAELKPEDLKIRPYEPTFTEVTGEGEEEGKPAASNEMAEGGFPVSEPKVIKTATKPKEQPQPKPQAVAEAKKPQALSPASRGPANGPWVVQAGAFSSKENAEKLAQKLKSFGSVRVDPIAINNSTTLHRVRVIGFASREAAEESLSRVEALGLDGAKVVKAE